MVTLRTPLDRTTVKIDARRSPDANATGFVVAKPAALRYENTSQDPDDVAMKLVSLVKRGGRLLDVGCGTGCITETLRRCTQDEVIGIEPDPERAAAARERGLTVFDGFLSEQFFEEHGIFDTIVFADVLEHVPSPATLVLLAERGLGPGGSIVISVPNVAHWSVRLELLFGRFNYKECGIMDATHLRFFTRDSLNQFLTSLGFRVTDHVYTLNTAMSEYRLLPPWKWLRWGVAIRVARYLLRDFPTLLGCQHVVKIVRESIA